MSKILVLAPSGFGKSSSIGAVPEYNIKGLDPSKTYIISKTTKPLPFKGSQKLYPTTVPSNIKGGKRVLAKNAQDVEASLIALRGSPFEFIILDDFNYIMQDWYMENALTKGWDAPKQIGWFMGRIFNELEYLDAAGKFVIVLAHGEDVPKPDGRIYTKLKTTGKMVDEYVTPEGKFDITLVGRSKYDSQAKKVVKEYITNEDEIYCSPKSPVGIFDQLYIPNDLSVVVEKIKAYYNG